MGLGGFGVLGFSEFLGEFLAVIQVQEVGRKVEEIKAVISVYCSFKSEIVVPSYGQKTVWS